MNAKARSEKTKTVTRHRPTTWSSRAVVIPAVSSRHRLDGATALGKTGRTTIMSAPTTKR